MEQEGPLGKEELEEIYHSPSTDFESLDRSLVNSPEMQFPPSTSVKDTALFPRPEFPGGLPYEYMKVGVEQSLPDLAGELIAAQCLQSTEVGQREEEMLRIQNELWRGTVLFVPSLSVSMCVVASVCTYYHTHRPNFRARAA